MAMSVLNDKFFRWVAKPHASFPIITMEKKRLLDYVIYRIWLDLVGTAVSPGVIYDKEGIHVPIDDFGVIKRVDFTVVQMSHTGEKLMSWLSGDLYGKYAGRVCGLIDHPVIGGTLGEVHWSAEQKSFEDLYIPITNEDELYLFAHYNASASAEVSEGAVNAYIHILKED